MDQETRKLVEKALALYGASLTEDGRIVNGTITRVGVRVKGRRLTLIGDSDPKRVLASGPIAEKTVCDFVEKFWYWKKKDS